MNTQDVYRLDVAGGALICELRSDYCRKEGNYVHAAWSSSRTTLQRTQDLGAALTDGWESMAAKEWRGHVKARR